MQGVDDLNVLGRLINRVNGDGRKLGAQERIDFYGFLRALVENGKDIQGACGDVARSLERQASETLLGAGQLKRAAQLYRYIEAEQKLGNALHVSLAGRVPDTEVMMLLAGAEGDITKGLKSAQVAARRSNEIKKAIAKAISYPAFLSLGVVAAMDWIGSNLMQTLTLLKPISQWTGMEAAVYWVTTNVATWAPLALVCLLVLVGVSGLIHMKFIGPGREAISGIPPLNIFRRLTATTFLSTLSSLVLAGTTFQNGLTLMRRYTRSEYLRYYLDEAIRRMKSGLASEGAGKAIASKLFTPWIMVKLDIYSRGTTEEFTRHMDEIAEDAQNEAVESLQKLSRALNILCLAVIAGTVMVTVITLFGVIGSIRSGLG